VKELEEKFKDLKQQRQKDDTEQRERQRHRRREATGHHQTLVRQHRAAERDLVHRELEVDRLERNLAKMQKESRLKSCKQSDSITKIDNTLQEMADEMMMYAQQNNNYGNNQQNNNYGNQNNNQMGGNGPHGQGGFNKQNNNKANTEGLAASLGPQKPVLYVYGFPKDMEQETFENEFLELHR